MSGDLVHVPDAARDPALTPTQRFEMIARTARGMEQYNAPRETGEPLNAQAKSQLAVLEQSKYLGAVRDARGLVTAEQYVTADARCGGAFCKGYQVPAGMRFDPQELFEALDIARKVSIPENYVFAYLAEMGRRLK